MSEQTGKHAAAQDEYLEQQTRRGVAHAEEFHRIEPAALDDEPERISHRTSGAGSPRQGMSQGEIDLRSRIAAALGRSAFPGDRERLIEVATGNRAEDRVLDCLRALPTGRRFENVQDTVRALGLTVEAAEGPR
ncbi:MAG TPA: DUF2795 domain-containing protein [Kineosporiaceae bacterium]